MTVWEPEDTADARPADDVTRIVAYAFWIAVCAVILIWAAGEFVKK